MYSGIYLVMWVVAMLISPFISKKSTSSSQSNIWKKVVYTNFYSSGLLCTFLYIWIYQHLCMTGNYLNYKNLFQIYAKQNYRSRQPSIKMYKKLIEATTKSRYRFSKVFVFIYRYSVFIYLFVDTLYLYHLFVGTLYFSYITFNFALIVYLQYLLQYNIYNSTLYVTNYVCLSFCKTFFWFYLPFSATNLFYQKNFLFEDITLKLFWTLD